MKRVLFITGIDDSHRVKVRGLGPRGIEYVLQGSIDLYQDLRDPRIGIDVVLLGGSEPGLPRVPRPDVIFNCISDTDLSEQALRLAMQVIRNLQVPRVINRPMHVLKTRRDDVATALAGIPGLQVPATVRIKPTSYAEILDALAMGPVRFPALIRRAGTHGGETMLLLRSAADRQLLEQIACDGTEYYLTQFVDFASPADGLYRKLRVLMIDGQPFIRHRIVGSSWNIHRHERETLMKSRPELVDEERDFLAQCDDNELVRWRPALEEIYRRLKLDYFSIDCAETPDGGLVLFEANASGNALRRHPNGNEYLTPRVERMREAVVRMLLSENEATPVAR